MLRHSGRRQSRMTSKRVAVDADEVLVLAVALTSSPCDVGDHELDTELNLNLRRQKPRSPAKPSSDDDLAVSSNHH